MTTAPRHLPRPRATVCPRPDEAAPAGFGAAPGFAFLPPADTVSSFDLDAESQRLLTEPAYARTGRNAITLTATPEQHLVLVAQRAGKRVESHRTAARVTVEVISGALRVRTGEGDTCRTADLGPRGLVTIEHHVVHSIEATQDSVFLLTISGGLRSD